MKKILTSGILTFTVFLILSCGGGSSSSSSADGTETIDNNETNETNQTSIIQGTVYDDIIVNLPYSTKDYDDYTNEDGKFNYDSGEVRFYLGTMLLGSVPAMPEDKKVFISDMLNLPRGTVDNKKLIKLARILQSLDTTPQSDNKIVLSKNQTSQIFSTPNQTLDNFDINSLTNHEISIITEDEAKQRIANTYDNEDITTIPANKPPVANAGADIVADEDQNITLDASASTSSDSTIVKYQWFEGTKSLHVGKTYTTNSLSIGTHTIVLQVTDSNDNTSSDSISVTINPKIITANKPPIVQVRDDIIADEKQSITFDANASDPDGSISRYEWFDGTTSLHVGETYTTNSLSVGTHTIILKATDNMGDTSSDSLKVTINQFQILSISPENNDKNVSKNANITIKFNTPIKNANQTTLQLKNSTDNTDITPLITIQDNNQTLIISNTLSADTKTYILTIKKDITNNFGASLAQDTNITFYTKDTISPTIQSTTPTNNQKINPNQNITITFSEKISPSTLNNITLKQGSKLIEYDINSASNPNITLGPKNTLDENATFTLTIPTSIQDFSGNNLSKNTIIHFTTADTTSPTIKSIKTDDLSKITITFSENIKTPTTSNFTLTPNDTNFDINNTNNPTIILNLNKTLDFAKEYNLTLKNITDNESNPLAQTTKTFTTQNSSVLQTGQTFCTDSSNNNIDCSNDEAKGQDGWYALKKLGKQRSYTRDDTSEIVTDSVTNLQWQDNEIAYKMWKDMGGGNADSYCKTLNLDGTNWTLPTIQQLKSIVDYNVIKPSINETYFKKTDPNYYWSSTPFDSDYARFVDFINGSGDRRGADMPSDVRCVRFRP